MLPRVDWIRPADLVILLFLSEHRWRLVVPPVVVAINTGLSNNHANRRLKLLAEAGLVDRVDEEIGKQGYYRINGLGERVIMGQVPADELEDRDPT